MNATYQLSQFTPIPLAGFPGVHAVFAEASDLGLPPGVFPTTLECVGLGNGAAFDLEAVMPNTEAHLYKQRGGFARVTIFND